jgi:prolactin regulatory element-binding protein
MTTRPAFVVKWNLADTDANEKDKEGTWEVGKVRKVGEKGITCFDVRSAVSLSSVWIRH